MTYPVTTNRWGTGWIPPTPVRPQPTAKPVGWYAPETIYVAAAASESTPSYLLDPLSWVVSAVSVSFMDTNVDISMPSLSVSEPGGGVEFSVLAGAESESYAPTLDMDFGWLAGAVSVSILDTGVDVDSPSNSISAATASLVPITAADFITGSVLTGDSAEAVLNVSVVSASFTTTGINQDSPSVSASIPGGGVAVNNVTAATVSESFVPSPIAAIGFDTTIVSGSYLEDLIGLPGTGVSVSEPGGGLQFGVAADSISASYNLSGLGAGNIDDLSVSSASASVSVIGVAADACSESEPDGDEQFQQGVEIITTAQIIDIPLWVSKIDALAVGGGGSGAGGNLTSQNGGLGGVWAYAQLSTDKLLLDAGVVRATVEKLYSKLNPGTGGAAVNGALSAAPGKPGGNSTVEFYAVIPGQPDKRLYTLTGVGGAGGSTGVGTFTPNGQAVVGGNINGGKDVLLNEVTYVGGGMTGISGAGNPPGGGGSGGGAGLGASSKGADGKCWMRWYSGTKLGQLSYTVPGDFTTNLPLTVENVFIAAVGGGRGGNSGPAIGWGFGGQGGSWGYGGIDVDLILSIKGLTRDRLTKLTLTGKVGGGGAGGTADFGGLVVVKPGLAGGFSTASLIAHDIDGKTYDMLIITGLGGSDPDDGLGQAGGAVRGGNASNGKDVTTVFNGKPITFKGGNFQPSVIIIGGGNAKGNPPGGGGVGGVIGGGEGGDGADGAVFVLYQ